MELGINPESWGRMPAGGVSPLLDWQGLRARFLATHSARRELGTDRPAPALGGSFDGGFARLLNDYAASQDPGLAPINPIASDDGNALDGKTQAVAGNEWPAVEE